MAAAAATAGLAGRHLFLFGLGHVAGRLVPMARRAGIGLSGSCRSPEAVARWRAQGVRAHLFDGRPALPDAALAGVTDVLVSIPPDPDPAANACRVLWPRFPPVPAHRAAVIDGPPTSRPPGPKPAVPARTSPRDRTRSQRRGRDAPWTMTSR